MRIDVLAFRVPHEPMSNDVDLSDYLVSIRDVEDETGLDFLHELPDDFENLIEWRIIYLTRAEGTKLVA